MKHHSLKVLRILEDVSGFFSRPGKSLSTFEFLFYWQNRTFLLTENQKRLLRSQCSQLHFFFYFSQQLLNSCLDFFSSSYNKHKFLDTLQQRNTSQACFLNPYDFKQTLFSSQSFPTISGEPTNLDLNQLMFELSSKAVDLVSKNDWIDF